MTADVLVFGLPTMLDRIDKPDLNDKLKGHLLLRQADLDGHDRNVIVKFSGGNYFLQALSTSLNDSY